MRNLGCVVLTVADLIADDPTNLLAVPGGTAAWCRLPATRSPTVASDSGPGPGLDCGHEHASERWADCAPAGRIYGPVGNRWRWPECWPHGSHPVDLATYADDVRKHARVRPVDEHPDGLRHRLGPLRPLHGEGSVYCIRPANLLGANSCGVRTSSTGRPTCSTTGSGSSHQARRSVRWRLRFDWAARPSTPPMAVSSVERQWRDEQLFRDRRQLVWPQRWDGV